MNTIRVLGLINGGMKIILTDAALKVHSSARPLHTDVNGRARLDAILEGGAKSGLFNIDFGKYHAKNLEIELDENGEGVIELDLPELELEIYNGGRFVSISPTRLDGLPQKSRFRLTWPTGKLKFEANHGQQLDAKLLVDTDAHVTNEAFSNNVEGGHRDGISFVIDSPPGGFWASLRLGGPAAGTLDNTEIVTTFEGSVVSSPTHVIAAMRRVDTTPRSSLWLDNLIRRSTKALSFDNYLDFMEWIFCDDQLARDNPIRRRSLKDFAAASARRRLPFTDTDAYRNVKVATEAFVMANCGVLSREQPDGDELGFIEQQVGLSVTPGELSRVLDSYLDTSTEITEGILPYLAIIRRKMNGDGIKSEDIGNVSLGKALKRPTTDRISPSDAKACYGLLKQRLQAPCMLELIWSYWQEEGMLVQTMNAITRRFQNVRAHASHDPLANMEVDPLRPLGNILWGYIQDEQHRLSVVRRNYEYDHHYGLRLAGKAVDRINPADSRSQFLLAFHSLLSTTSAFYKRDDDTTIVADGFPVLNALKEAHLILSQGAHNQFGDLPSTARIEMLMQQWMLARPEFREFLPTRIMVAYPEPWMDRVDAMKKLQGWSDTSVLHFRNLAIFGEQVLLSVRWGNWNDVNDPVQAVNWARYWRSEVQGYMHAYRSVTGIDLTLDVTNSRIDATLPSVHLVRRLSEQRTRLPMAPVQLGGPEPTR